MASAQHSLGLVQIAGQRSRNSDVHRVDTAAQRQAELLDERRCVRGGGAGPSEVAMHGQTGVLERGARAPCSWTFATSPPRKKSQNAIPSSAGVGPHATGRSLASNAERSSAGSPACRARAADRSRSASPSPARPSMKRHIPSLLVRTREIRKVTRSLQTRGDLECLAELVLDVRRGIDPRAKPTEVEAGVRLDGRAPRPRDLDRRAQDLLRTLQLAASGEGKSEIGKASSRLRSSPGSRSTPRCRRPVAAGRSARPSARVPAASNLTAARPARSSAAAVPASSRRK